jgi:putative DNA primase/helicase
MRAAKRWASPTDAGCRLRRGCRDDATVERCRGPLGGELRGTLVSTSDLVTTAYEGLALFHPPGSGHVFEVRVPTGRDEGDPVHSGHFDNLDLAASAVEAANKYGASIYVTLNPVDPAQKPVTNRIVECVNTTTCDRHIARRRRLLLDMDAQRDGVISAREDELRAGLERRDAVVEWLTSRYGWPRPALAMSGNGGHAVYAIDLAVGKDSARLVAAVLKALHHRHGDAVVKVDTTVGNASRVCKVYGTIARKGESTPERPHRRAEIEEAPGRLVPVTLEQLQAVAALAPTNGTRSKGRPVAATSAGRDVLETRARAYLAKLPASVEGNGGDHQLFVAAATLRDFGLEQSDALALLHDYNQRAVPAWSDREVEKKIENAWRYAKGEAGAKAAENGPGWAEVHSKPSAGAKPDTSRSGGAADPEDVPVLDPSDPVPSARALIAQAYTHGGARALQHQAGVFYQFFASYYRETDEAAVRAGAYRFLEAKLRLDKNRQVQPFKPTKSKVENVLDAMRAVCNLPADSAAPCWLEGGGAVDPLDVLPCGNGLLHIPTRELLPATPRFFATNGVAFAFDASASAPEAWLRFLGELWPDDGESRETLQEWIGYQLTPRTHFQKIGMIVGPRRSGKGTIARVTRRLLGERNVCGPTLAGMGEPFGLSVLIGKASAIIADARISGRTDTAIVTERLLSISGEDGLTIARKYLPDWTGKLSVRFTLLTNELPRLEDESGALASRFVVLRLQESFYGREDHGLFERLVPELPGILNWALAGWDRLYQRGQFRQPAASAELIQQLEDLGSPIGAFLRDRCEVGAGYAVAQHALFDSWRGWCLVNGRDKPGTIQSFARNLLAAVPWLVSTRPRVDGAQVRHWQGVRLFD